MKFWQKLTISVSIGILLGILLPLSGGDTQSVLKILNDILISIGSYILIPLMFTQVVLATTELANNKLGKRFIGRTLILLIASSLFFSLIGALAVMILPVDRIPIIIEESSLKEVPTIESIVQSLLTPNAIQILAGPVQFMPGIFLFAIVFGFGLHLQRNSSKIILDFFEATSRVFFSLNRYVVDILIYGTAIMLSSRIVTIRQTPDIGLFLRLFLVIGLLGFLITFVVYPLVLRVLGINQKPLAWLRHSLAPLLVGLCSGNNFLPLGIQMKNGSDNWHYPRRIWAWYFPLASIIGRAGTTMVTTISFFLVLRSYSNLEISVFQFLFIIVGSFLLGAIPNGRILAGLAMMATWFGQGIEQGYLILQPVAPILISAALLFDVINQAFVAYVLNHLSIKETGGMQKDHSSKLQDEFNIS